MKKLTICLIAVMMLGFISVNAGPAERMVGTVQTVNIVYENGSTRMIATVALQSGAYYNVIVHTPKTVSQKIQFILLPDGTGMEMGK